jgi:hypothetical protein
VTPHIEDDSHNVDWQRLSDVYTRAPLPVEQDAERLRRTYANSDVTCFAYDDELLIGAVRALSRVAPRRQPTTPNP